MLRLCIEYDFPNWNDYVKAERANKYLAAKIKKNEKEYIGWTVKEKWTGGYPVELKIRPHYSSKRQDLDNFRMKGLIDGLVGAGVLKNDNLTCIQRITLEPVFDGRAIVEVEIEEVEHG